MLSNLNKTVNVNAVSTVDGKAVLYMNTSIRTGETPNINMSYKDIELYNANKETVDADFEEFKQKVFAMQ